MNKFVVILQGGEDGGMRSQVAAKEKKNGMGRSKAASPKLAPQFDGLHCFETIVRR